MVRAAGSPGICELELALMTLEVVLGNVVVIGLGEGFRLTHPTNEMAAATATMDRHP